ncbi:MAG: class I SAM-dependent methyltransferase [Byssovorax sp.]
MSAPRTDYDRVPYPAGVFDHTHPSRLATLATLFGMRPAPVERCRVLELGCSRGNNLIPMAEALPASSFVGIDLAELPIAEGQAFAAGRGLENIRLAQQDILDFEVEPGAYDYIIAHGVYSWVPPAVQEKVLAIFERGLAPQGVGYLSYNALPGGHLRRMLRDLMRYHTRDIEASADRMKQARAIAAFVAAGSPAQSGLYKDVMTWQRERLEKLSDEYLFHDDMAEHNEALYFHELVARAGRHGLAYLADACFADMQIQRYAPDVRAVLGKIDDLVSREQYLDFVGGRAFRRSLLVRGDVALDRRLDGRRVRGFFFASRAAPRAEQLDLTGEAVVRFENSAGVVVGLGSPLAKAAMTALHEAAPAALSFEELGAAAKAKLGQDASPLSPAEEDELGELILAMYGGDMIELYSHRPRAVRRAGEKPLAWALSRAQAALGSEVTTLLHGNVRLDDPANRRLLTLLDGTRDRGALARSMADGRSDLEARLAKLGEFGLLES